MAGHDIFYFLDIIILIAVLIWRPELKEYKMKKRFASLVILSGIALFFINLHYAEKDRPRTADKNV